MATCPLGHPSGDEDYCDTCGSRMLQPCPVCRTPRGGRFCEIDGYDFVEGGPGAGLRGGLSLVPSPRTADLRGQRTIAEPSGATAMRPRWEAVTGADRAYYDKVIAHGGPDAAKVVFPPYCPQRSFALADTQVRIGRRSRLRNLQPEIDLAGPPEDPGVSHLHAVLLAQSDGSWTLLDPGSANGTRLNGTPVPINVPFRLGDGDCIHLGAWTTIRLRAGNERVAAAGDEVPR